MGINYGKSLFLIQNFDELLEEQFENSIISSLKIDYFDDLWENT